MQNKLCQNNKLQVNTGTTDSVQQLILIWWHLTPSDRNQTNPCKTNEYLPMIINRKNAVGKKNRCYRVGDPHSSDNRLLFSHHCTPDTTINSKANEHLLTNNIFKYKKNMFI